ncbi:MAG: cardiolipin synthase ClsB [Bradymonadales bacterium]|nr:MAG: cardiolipin synthase ClsB [Bradymonadales bacterium]
MKTHQVKFIEGGDQYFSDLIEAIDRAQEEVLFLTYIFEADSVGIRVATALKRAAHRGVRVRLMIDAHGSLRMPQSFIDSYFSDGVHFERFRPKKFPWVRFDLFPRLHAKLVVIDRKESFIGGMNIIADHLEAKEKLYKHDYMAHIHGPIASMAADYCQWLMSTHGKRLGNLIRGQSEVFINQILKKKKESQDIEFLVRDNLLRRRDIYREYIRKIKRAKSEVLIANAYFLPPQSMLRALRKAAKRGVRVRLLLQGISEFPILKAASRNLYAQLLGDGVEILEHNNYLVHEKVAVIDQEWATLGSHNLDPTSVFFNLEANAVFHRKEDCDALRRLILRSIEGKTQARQLEEFSKRALWRKAVDLCALWVLKVSFSIFTQPDLYN